MLWKRLAIAIALPLLLASCLLTPGKFTSTLAIHADGGFAFTYQGEVIAPDDPPMAQNTDKAKAAADQEIKRRAIAEALAKEEGYRSVKYLSGGKFVIDYAIAGRLDHGFVFPFNVDAEAILPFVAIELRKDGIARVMAPGFANDKDKTPGGMAGADMGQGNTALDGRFTLTTDAEIVMQNSEEGVKPAGAAKTIAWRATPLSRTAPTAVLRLKR